jgi:hypothetical protein
MDVNELLPWGLTIAQTGLLCFGGMLLLGGWLFIKNLIGVAKSGFLMGLALLMACIFLAMIVFYLANSQ